MTAPRRDPATIKSNTFTMEWPPESGKQMEFPEVDRTGWFGVSESRVKLSEQMMRLVEELGGEGGRRSSSRAARSSEKLC